MVLQRTRSPLTSSSSDRPNPSRTRSPAVPDNMPDHKKHRPNPDPVDNSDDEKSDQDLVVDEVGDVSFLNQEVCDAIVSTSLIVFLFTTIGTSAPCEWFRQIP